MEIKAKRHALIGDLSKELRGLRISDTFAVLGHRYKLGLLSPSEMDWVMEKASNTSKNLVEMATLMQRPLIAAALAEIDDIPVAQLFQLPDDMEKATREVIEGDVKLLTEWRREQVFQFLGEDVDVEILKELGGKYFDLESKKRAHIGEIRNLSKGTPSKG